MNENEILRQFQAGECSLDEAARLLDKLRNSATYPLSEGQKGLWFLERVQPGSAGYNVPLCFTVPLSVELEHLRGALEFLVRQHPILNSEIVERNGVPFQRQRLGTEVEIQSISVESSSSAEITALLRRQAKVPIDLTLGPMYRFHVFTGRTSHAVLIVIHHIVFDAASVGPLLHTMDRAYLALLEGKTPAVLPVAVSYSDFVDWERAYLKGEAAQRALAHWRDYLRELPGPLSLANESVSTRRADGGSATVFSDLPADLSARIRLHCANQHVTPAVLFLSVFHILLSRYGGTHDVVTGMATMGRPLAAYDALVGYFVNMIPVRTQVHRDQSFNDLLGIVKGSISAGLDHAAYPFALLTANLADATHRGAAPIFQVAYAFQNTGLFYRQAVPAISMPLEVVSEVHQEGEFKLTLEVSDSSERFRVFFKYTLSNFTPVAMETMQGHFMALLTNALETPNGSIGKLSLMTPRECLVREAANATESQRFDCYLESGFVQLALQHPGKVAIDCSDYRMTYGELLLRSCTLAQHLLQHGAVRNQLIAVIMNKGWEQVVAVLGILLSGAAYLPIDPVWPAERRNTLLREAEARLAVTQPVLEEVLQLPSLGIHSACVSKGDVCGEVPAIPSVERSPEDLAYVIFTSGSSGKPKGVVIDHRAAVNTVLHVNRLFDVTSVDRILAISELHFDLSVYDLFGILSAGGTIVYPDGSRVRDPAHWYECVVEHQVTIWNSVPQLMQLLVEYVELLGPPTEDWPLRVALLSGDWIPLSLPTRVRGLCGQTAVISLGGATEGAIWSIYYRVTEIDPTWESVPYGKALPNQQMYVLDADMQICPDYVTGEVVIGGEGVALGYWRNDALSRAQFVGQAHTRQRLYKTGDLGRYLPDGNIQFLGRADQQVKIHGYRVELGEIESHLVNHPQVKQAVVTADTDSLGERRLEAYFVPNEDGIPTRDDLRHYLEAHVPGYMIPVSFTRLAEVPLSANGKLERNLLKATRCAAPVKSANTPPEGEVESAIAAAWQEVLRVTQVSRYDNFFELGGHSLLLVQVMARLRTVGLYGDAHNFLTAANLHDLAQLLCRREPAREIPANRLPAQLPAHKARPQSTVKI